MARVLITTVPFGAHNNLPLELLASTDVEYSINPLGRRLKEAELAHMAVDTEIIIAGTEPITAMVMNSAPHLKLISRVGIGLDNVDLLAARERGIAVSYTPEAPAPAVAELTIGLMLSLLRHTNLANLKMHQGQVGSPHGSADIGSHDRDHWNRPYRQSGASANPSFWHPSNPR